MKTIIAGSRGIESYAVVKEVIEDSGFEITEVVSGGARGVDKTGEQWAKKNNIPIKRFLPDWRAGRQAGMLRNVEMGNYADALIAIWDGTSSGTKHMIDYATRKGLKIFLFKYDSVPTHKPFDAKGA